MPAEMQLQDVKLLTLPALLFTVNSILVYVAIGQNDLAVFAVFQSTVILWTAVMWRYVFQTSLNWTRWLGILVIFLGLAMNKAFDLHKGHMWSWTFIWVLVMTLCNASGSVASEFALKRNKALDINFQNIVLYIACIVCDAAFIGFTDPSKLRSSGRFFEGFSNYTFAVVGLQALLGLTVSRLLKYTDSVMKTVAGCLTGPLTVVLAPHFVSSPKEASTLVSALLVSLGCFAYLSQGPMQTPQEKASLKEGGLCSGTPENRPCDDPESLPVETAPPRA